MGETDVDNTDQRTFWTETAGPKWLTHEAALDPLLLPVLNGVINRSGLKNGEVVVDVGCGTGASTVQIAEIVGPTGHVLGVDISQPMLARAEARTKDRGNVSFMLADATDHRFDEGCFHHLMSRFGVMFFADPVAAFTNMAKALRPNGKVTFAAWGQIPENPFFTAAAQVAREVIGAPPKTDPDLPGPFAFRDPDRVIGILRQAGLTDPACDTASVDLTPSGSADQFATLLASIGPADAAATHFEASEADRARLREALAGRFAEFQTEKGLRVPSQINYFTATKA